MRDRLRILGWPQRKRRDSSDPGHAGERRECRRLSEYGPHLPGDGVANQPGAVAQSKLRCEDRGAVIGICRPAPGRTALNSNPRNAERQVW